MRISKEKWAKMKSRGRAIGAKVGAGWKDSAKAVAAGAGAFYVADFASQKVDMLRNTWWALPATMAVGGHFLRRKSQTAGIALLGAAGYQGALSYRMRQPAQPAQPGTAKPPDALGLQDDYAPEFDAAALQGDASRQGPTSGAPSAMDAAELMPAPSYDSYDDYAEAAALQT